MLLPAIPRREKHSIRNVTKQQFIDFMKAQGGFAYGGFCGSEECEGEIKEAMAATIRVVSDTELRSAGGPKTGMWCGKPSGAGAVWAQAHYTPTTGGLRSRASRL